MIVSRQSSIQRNLSKVCEFVPTLDAFVKRMLILVNLALKVNLSQDWNRHTGMWQSFETELIYGKFTGGGGVRGGLCGTLVGGLKSENFV